MASQKCKECKSEFHYCGGCGRDGYSEKGYCDSYCMQKAADRAASEVCLKYKISPETLVAILEELSGFEDYL